MSPCDPSDKNPPPPPYQLLVKVDRDTDENWARDVKALITNGLHMERLIREDVIPLLQKTESEALGLHPDEHSDTLRAFERAVYEWDKRARRTGMDWWNR